MMQLTMLGTGNATVTKCYNTCFLLSENDEYFMIDAGGGNQILSILEEQKVPLTKIHDLFVTHSHSDHILGVVWMVRMIGQMMNKDKYDGELRIYAHESVIEDLKAICKIVLVGKIIKLFNTRMKFIPICDGDSHRILNRTFKFFDIGSTKLLQYAFEIPEEKLLFCGDEPLKEEFLSKADGVKYLLHEAFCLYEQRDIFQPYEKHHSTVKDVCQMAEEKGIPNVILMHTEDKCIFARKEKYMKEGRAFYSGNLFIPDDGEKIELL